MERNSIFLPPIIFFTICFVIIGASSNDNRPAWAWKCEEDNCLRIEEKQEVLSSCLLPIVENYPSVEVCRLVCGPNGALWPKPTIMTNINNKLIHVNPNNVHYKISETTEVVSTEAKQFLEENVDIFRENIKKDCLKTCKDVVTKLMIHLTVTNSSLNLDWNTDERYILVVKTEDDNKQISVQIQAQTVFGARHALESLSQLIARYEFSAPKCGKVSALVMPVKAFINDKPVYPHRGLLIDTARNFLSVKSIERQIDGLAASKMNVLHWHVTDTQSFPFESTSVPELTKYGAYSAKQIYKPKDVAHLIKYAKVRGVRIILEIDAPAHAGNGWQWGPSQGLGNLAVCVNKEPWRDNCVQPPCGQLNPINKELYPVLGKLYHDIVKAFPKGEVFHMGGDEVHFGCWNSTEEILHYLHKTKKGRYTKSFLDLWGHFQNEALKAFDKQVGDSSTPFIVWSSHLTDPEIITKYLDKSRYVIQTWVPFFDNLPQKLLELNYKLIISTKDAWYLDHGVWGSTQYHNWQVAYNNRIMEDKKVLGGEACSWGEYVDNKGIDSRVWPRTAAVGERLWTNPSTTHAQARNRFIRHRERLISRGIKANAVIPRWCYQNEGQCP